MGRLQYYCHLLLGSRQFCVVQHTKKMTRVIQNFWKIKVKGKSPCVHAMSAYWGVEVELHIFFTLTLWILDQAALSSGVGTPVFLIGGSVSPGPVGRFGEEEYILPWWESNPESSRPWPSRCIHWAISVSTLTSYQVKIWLAAEEKCKMSAVSVLLTNGVLTLVLMWGFTTRRAVSSYRLVGGVVVYRSLPVIPANCEWSSALRFSSRFISKCSSIWITYLLGNHLCRGLSFSELLKCLV